MFDFVNSYYEQVSPIIRTFKGFIVKYMGDGVMAVFPNRNYALKSSVFLIFISHLLRLLQIFWETVMKY